MREFPNGPTNAVGRYPLEEAGHFLLITENNGRPFFRFELGSERFPEALLVTSEGLGADLTQDWWIYSLDGLLWIFNGTDWIHTVKTGPGYFSNDSAASAKFPEEITELLPDAMTVITPGREVFRDPHRRRHRHTFPY
ncbi:hypothetical protein GCM10007100_39900 [Roseibacillus persicicus]|uniref:Uncharacterized protein n=1 Tax=Roseibacillus persicicus TaxID=454148 RepID=A0A918TZC5_9BACT|nr:hypothetical protein GCM10007100_39900 [Roseibacillus persicicus]